MLWCIASILSGFPAVRVGSTFSADPFFRRFSFSAAFVFSRLFLPPISADFSRKFCWGFCRFWNFSLTFCCSFFFENHSNFVRLFGFHFFPSFFNRFSLGAKFVVSGFLLCMWNRFEKPEGLYLLYLAFFNFLSNFVN